MRTAFLLIRRIMLFSISLCIPSVALALSSMSADEHRVRATYARCSYSTEILAATNAAAGHLDSAAFDAFLNAKTLTFQLTNFKSWSKSEFGVEKLGSMVIFSDLPEEQTIQLSGERKMSAEGPVRTIQEFEAAASWRRPDRLHASGQVDHLADALKGGQYPWITRLVTFTVTARLDSISKVYEAAAVFGTDAAGNSEMAVLDPGIFAGAMNEFDPGNASSQYTVYPSLLLTSIAFDTQPGRAYLKRTSVPDQECQRGGCFTNDRYGPSSSDVQRKLANPLGAPVPGLQKNEKPGWEKGLGRNGNALKADILGSGTQTSCSAYNYGVTSPYFANTDSTGHIYGYHGIQSQFQGSCSYQSIQQSVQCLPTAYASPSVITPLENGTLKSVVGTHTTPTASLTQPAVNGTANAGVGVAVAYCLVPGACGISVSFSAPPVGFQVSGSTIWTQQYGFSNTCVQESLTCAVPPPPGIAPYIAPGIGSYVWSPGACAWVVVYCNTGICSSPIVIDTDGSGFQLTTAAKGVLFDFYGYGQKVQIAWTQENSTNGWLALDRNGNGTIDNARELFGNITAQEVTPASTNLNGFLALAEFDSNRDGVIDSKDAVWPSLLVWIDKNHDGISLSAELYHLDSLGIRSIDLAYVTSAYTDSDGNQFRYKGSFHTKHGDNINRSIYDVFLKTLP